MPDASSIGLLLGSIKSAIDIAKYLNEAGSSIERAELKLKFADLTNTLADAKLEMISIQESLAEKDRRIAELNDAFEMRLTLFRHGDAFFEKDSDGNPKGVAHCLRCWESDHKARQLVDFEGPVRQRICTACGQKYSRGTTWDAQ
jgi:hypothetical protein